MTKIVCGMKWSSMSKIFEHNQLCFLCYNQCVTRVEPPLFMQLLQCYAAGTGDIISAGSDSGPGAFHCLNVPLQDGLRDDVFNKILTRSAPLSHTLPSKHLPVYVVY